MAEEKKEKDYYEKVFIALVIVAVIAFMIWIGSETNSEITKIILGFSPLIINVILLGVIVEKVDRSFHYVIWGLPFIVVILFLALAKSDPSGYFSGLDVENLVVLNLIISYVFVLIINYIESIKHREKQQKKSNQPIIVNKPADENQVKSYVQSIEDKCKAINFVIGRVYKTKSGGTPEIRASIKIPKEWYNKFYESKSKYTPEKNKLVCELSTHIEAQLKRLFLTEKKVFGVHAKGLKRIQRNKDGSSRIIDVLIANDKDPIKDYVESALEFCRRAKAQCSI